MFFFAFVLFVTLLTFLFDDLLEYQINPNQQINTIANSGYKELKLQRNKMGHYVSNGMINGTPVVFLLDTGATVIALSANLARKLQLKTGRAFNVSTANGISKAYRATLKTVSLGEIQLNEVPAAVLSNTSDNHVLLGMTFLKHMELIQKGDFLTIRQLSTPPT